MTAIETQTTLPEIYQRPEYGDLVKLPTIHNENKTSLLNATTASAALTEKWAGLNLPDVSPEKLAEIDSELNNMIVKLGATEKTCMDKRKPFTSFMDEIKTEFTTIEKSVAALAGGHKLLRDNIARERIRRAEEESKKQELAIATKNEEISVKSHALQTFSNNFSTRLANGIERMNSVYNSKPATELEAYGAKLQAWTPVWDNAAHDEVCKNGEIRAKHLEADYIAGLLDAVKAELFGQFQERYAASMMRERDRLIELIPSRLKELATADQAAIDARLKREQDERDAAAKKEQADRDAQLQLQAEADKLNATFEVAATANEVPEQTKNVVKKKKYEVSSHAGIIALLQLWISSELPGMTVAELEKKLSFAVTFGNKKLNEGTELQSPGLKVVEDISTRAVKGKP